VRAACGVNKRMTLVLLVRRRDAAHSLTWQLCARFGAGGLAGGEPRLDAGALVAAAAGGVRCAE
jgi:hypothetical protein